MKYLLLLSISFILLGCGSDQGISEEQPHSLQETDLTGTWVMTNEVRRTNVITGEYLSSEYFEYRYIMEENDNGVNFNKCWEYGGFKVLTGVKTSQHFYMFLAESGFALSSDGVLKQVSSLERSWEPDFNFESVKTLRKLSDGIEIDSGSFILNGPVSVEEYDHVCAWQVYSNVGSRRTLEIIVPYGSTHLSLHFLLIGEIPTGEYYYADSWEAESIIIDVLSNDSLFRDQRGTNTLSPDNVTINIVESNDEKMVGTFAFMGQDNGSYNGQFEIYLTN